ncbi:MAG: L,D-transpeptidase family protein [Thiohalophilus sp.]|uniref:L,D-transpeptidase Cds6 family protein n=1 Tax=Thiohalophilus sp. TaxID=3028392 RepID=UPI002870633D|nr:L,D-transpeptidase family protein [Thiohalophilus sp.]MDR9436256.1 L,D-transpeptidase family protein [Thiohalophilus sp.]
MTIYRHGFLTGLLLGSSLLLPGALQAEPTLLANLATRENPGAPLSLERQLGEALSHLDKRLAVHPADHEASLLKGLIYFRSGNLEAALRELDALRQRAPNFQLAHMVYADLRMMKWRPVNDIGNAQLFASLSREARDVLQGLQQEADYRLGVHLDKELHSRIPRQILTLSDNVGHAIVVDKSRHRLFLFERQGKAQPPRLVRDYYVSTGRKQGNKVVRGDLRTPEGVYFVTNWIPDEELPERYGIGAFPVNYPNELDRKQGKTGYGIWLHGTEREFYSRPPLDSEGCVVLSNYDLDAIKHEIKPGVTPVIITSRIDWIDEQTWRNERHEILQALQQWEQDWESLDTERYLSHYADSFWTRSHDIQSWKRYKRQVAQSKTFQDVKLEDISLFSYPRVENQQGDLVVARMHQTYRSNNFNSEIQKRLYLTRRDGQWRIVYEGR